jgi:regulator of cell morphogenesis and NO signaling
MEENKIFEIENTVGSMVTLFPKSADVFNKFKIDYCCAGDDTLNTAASKVGASPAAVMKELKNAYEEFLTGASGSLSSEDTVNYDEFSNEDLINHILDTHHVYTKEALHEIDALVFKILKVHFASHSEELLEVHHLFGLLKTELEEHLIKEEEQLFPAMLEYENTKSPKLFDAIADYIESTENEHDAAGDIFKSLQKVTRDFSPPAGACLTYVKAYEELEALEKNIFTHIHKENSILFKRFTKSEN